MTKFMFGLLLAIGTQANAAEYLVKYRNQDGVRAVQNYAQSKSFGMQIIEHAYRSYHIGTRNNKYKYLFS